MPTLTRWFVKSALVDCAAALVVGVALAAQLPLNLPSSIGNLTPVYFHLFLVGWIAQFIFGVVY